MRLHAYAECCLSNAVGPEGVRPPSYHARDRPLVCVDGLMVRGDSSGF